LIPILSEGGNGETTCSMFLYKQESSSKSRQARVDKKETGGKQETAIDEKAENTVKECTNWKDKKKDKEQEALLISEDTAFEFVKEKVREAKRANREAREKRKKAREEMDQNAVAAFENMKFYKFYPVATPDTPDVSKVQSRFINRSMGLISCVLTRDGNGQRKNF
ncbi:heat intolerant 4-like protein, partial [Tanacetum coccineum]